MVLNFVPTSMGDSLKQTLKIILYEIGFYVMKTKILLFKIEEIKYCLRSMSLKKFFTMKEIQYITKNLILKIFK